jgi:hypothetical protein
MISLPIWYATFCVCFFSAGNKGYFTAQRSNRRGRDVCLREIQDPGLLGWPLNPRHRRMRKNSFLRKRGILACAEEAFSNAAFYGIVRAVKIVPFTQHSQRFQKKLSSTRHSVRGKRCHPRGIICWSRHLCGFRCAEEVVLKGTVWRDGSGFWWYVCKPNPSRGVVRQSL